MADRGFLLVDANVLVDYQAGELAVLSLVSRHLGPVHIVSTVLAEVDGLDASDCEAFGLRIVEPTLAQATEAASAAGRLSFADRVCLIVCRDCEWICVSLPARRSVAMPHSSLKCEGRRFSHAY